MLDCIEWEGATQGDGYGARRIDGVLHSVHRLAWQEANGPIPSGLQVLHHCDNPPCHNPDHLFLGTQSDNMRDCLAKGRHASGHMVGENHGMSKLTEEQVRYIKEIKVTRPYTGVLGRAADEFGVARGTIDAIRSGRNWKHVGA
ncbi:hypothetical protein LCGC14_0490930 [marine sediment metagenome]|uniref:HNH nuclease domain-containing protein n=1 Tax=marine sediment metagenome TaxID=412755 RepID=A0A0F9S6I1_9ZZZZ